MKIVSFGPKGEEKPGVVYRDKILDLVAANASIPTTVRRILEVGALSRVEAVLNKADSLPAKCFKPASQVRLGPPVTDPTKIICIGMNYKDHAEEQDKQVPDWPLTFAKAPSALAGTGDRIDKPAGVNEMDHEVELAVVIGKRAKNVPIGDAHRHVAGYSIILDISARDVQYREKQFFRAKSFDGFAPMGPYLVTAAEIPDPQKLDISLQVNGTTFQESNTRQMTFTVPYLVHYLSHSMTLEAGDIIATGTPGGVGKFALPPRFLQAGDEITAAIESIGSLTNTVA